jgi:hypothetical protein
MSILGQILLWAGFLAGSLATVFRLEIADDKWSTIDWSWYGISVAVGVAGVIMIRASKLAARGTSQKSQADLEQIRTNLDHLIVSVETFHQNVGQMTPKQMLEFIDNNLADDLREFADGRESITIECGLAVFAEVMTHFAAGERAINRAWSAAADRYVDEAATCVERAMNFLHEAKRELDAAAG